MTELLEWLWNILWFTIFVVSIIARERKNSVTMYNSIILSLQSFNIKRINFIICTKKKKMRQMEFWFLNKLCREKEIFDIGF